MIDKLIKITDSISKAMDNKFVAYCVGIIIVVIAILMGG